MKFPAVQVIPITACNKKCEYCDIPNLNQTFCSFEEFQKGLSVTKLIDHQCLNICGGEPGLLPQKYIDFLLDEYCSKETVSIVTNGILFEKISGKIDKFLRILYHVFPEKTPEIEHPMIHENVIYTVVLHEKNIQSTLEFIKKNKNIKILVIPYSPKNILPTDDLRFQNIEKLREIARQDNIQDDTKFKIDKIIKFYFNDQKNYKYLLKKCSSISIYPTFDLINKRLLKCCCSYTNSGSVELNEENVRNIMNLKFDGPDKICDGCFLFFNKTHFPYLMKRMIDERC